MDEIELKLRLSRQSLPRLLRHPLLAAATAGSGRTRRLVSLYYDTPRLDLSRQRVALRLRKVGRRWIQTVKAEGTVSAGLHRRPEWEAPLAGGRPDLTKLDDPELDRIFGAAAVRDHLQPVFRVDVHRTTRALRFPDGTRAELAVDRGEVRAGGRVHALSEIELELESGSPRPLFELALELQQSLPLEVEMVSKAERGYRLLAEGAPPAVKARQPALAADVSVNDALKVIAAACVSQLEANVEGMRGGGDVEFLHQMRVALRRLRSVLSTFATAYPQALFAPVQDELRWLTGELGPARDWDVFVTETLPPVREAFPGHAGLARLAGVCRRLQRSANARARATADSPRFRRLMLGLSAWINCEPWLSGLAPEQIETVQGPLKPFAGRILSERRRRVTKRGRQRRALAPAELHTLRITAKKLRYAAEFFAGLYPARASRGYITRLQGLQEVLGAINDGATCARLLEEAARSTRDAAALAAVGIVSGWTARMALQRRQALEHAWKAFRGEKPFWENGS